MNAITFKNVNFSYEGGSFAIKNLNFSVEEGEFAAILGHNGSGKSTLARLCNRLLAAEPSEDGESGIRIFGMDVSDKSNLFEVRKNVGIVFQNPDNQMVASIVEDDIAFGAENIGLPREEIGRRIDFALEAVGMEEFRHSTPTRLSGGQKQRIAIAGVLAVKPRILILDEATAMLDPKGRKEVMDVVMRLNKEDGITVLMITHFMEEALLADRAIVMNEGEIVMSGTPQEIFARSGELVSYHLELPRIGYICKRLQEGGMPVSDTLDIEKLAEDIAQCVSLPNI